MQNGMIFYEKQFVSGNLHNGFILSYPEERKNEYDVTAGNIERSFIPGWRTGYKIWG